MLNLFYHFLPKWDIIGEAANVECHIHTTCVVAKLVDELFLSIILSFESTISTIANRVFAKELGQGVDNLDEDCRYHIPTLTDYRKINSLTHLPFCFCHNNRLFWQFIIGHISCDI